MRFALAAAAASLLPLLLCACSTSSKGTMQSIAQDVHSYANAADLRVSHVSLDLEVLFGQRTLRGTALLSVEHVKSGATKLTLDSRALQIDEAETSRDGKTFREARFDIGKPDAILGAPIHIDVEKETRLVRIRYSTSPSATALQWLTPEQTAGKKLPFLYTQGEAIHTRSWIPLQDSPGVRVTYDARIRVPAGMKAVMSATNCPDKADCTFVMDRAIPPYLIALAVGDLKFKETGPRTGVWAEPSVLPKAVHEFADVEKMLGAAEKLYGPYRWERYDVLVLPPSFPFGGMENPRLTFATPTILAGDRSLVSLVAHELAHSWSGNLVTNATWSDFWLNEGYTVYIERRILEELYGRSRALMEATLGYDDLQQELKTHTPKDQILAIDLHGRDPDDGMTEIPYEKGALFLLAMEKEVGREKFDAYLKSYFDHWAFQSITTRQALEYLHQTLPTGVPVNEWVYQPGLPQSAPHPVSAAFAAVDKEVPGWISGGALATEGWSTQEWLHFLGGLPKNLKAEQMARLDHAFRLTETHNDEILAQWLLMAVRTRYSPADARLSEFLNTVGRRKYVKPIFEALVENGQRDKAQHIYETARPAYHYITQQTVEGILRNPGKAQ